jgi:hypothetical protein
MAQQTIRSTAYRAVDSVITNGSKAYDRGRILPRVLPIGPDELAGAEPETTRRIVLKLASALRTERARGRAGHWTYDLNRHVGLMQALKAEQERLAQCARERLIRGMRIPSG